MAGAPTGEERARRALLVLRHCNRAMVRCAGEPELLQEVCHLLIEKGGYRLCWVGEGREDASKEVVPLAFAGHADGYLARAAISWDESPRGQGPTGRALRTGQPQASRFILTDPAMEPWRDQARRMGFESSLALPLKVPGRHLSIQVYSTAPDAFDGAEMELLADLADDLGYAVANLAERAHRSASEEAYRSIFENAAEGMFRTDLQGRFLTVNPALARMAGFASVEEMLASGATSSMFYEDPADRSRIIAALDKGGAPQRREVRMHRRDGTPLLARLHIARLATPDGPVLQGMIEDVTGERRAEAAERAAALDRAESDRLRELNAFRAHMMNMVAHEIKNPISPIRLEMAILRRPESGQLTEHGRRALEVLGRNVERVVALTNDLLEASRLGTGTIKLARKPTDLSALAREACDSFQTQAKESGLELTVAGGPAVVDVDGDRISQVLFNLVSNALKYTPRGGHVRVEVQAVPQGARVEVKDDGLGLTPEQAATLFVPFVRIHDPVHPDALRGTGLGLYISKGMVELHGGSIGMTSPGAGQGSTFWFEVPAVSPAPASPPGGQR